MKLFARSPQGRFIDRYSVVPAWLPAVLDASHYSWQREGALRQAVAALACWCEAQARSAFQAAAGASCDNRHSYARSKAKQAEQWLQRSEMLRDLVAKLETMPQ